MPANWPSRVALNGAFESGIGGLHELEGSASGGAGETKIDNPRLAVGSDEQVVWLDVAVDQARRVGGGQTTTGAEQDGEQLGPRQSLLKSDSQGPAFDESHDHEARFPVMDVINGYDVGVSELG